MRPRGMKLSRRHKVCLYFVFSLLYISGLLWILLHYCMQYQGHMGESTHPLEYVSLKVHGAAAMLALIMLGTMIPIHIKRGYAMRINLGNGVMFIGVNILLILTGYALYYAGGEKLRFFSHCMHVIFGILFPAFLVWHIVEGRKNRLKKLHKPGFSS